MKIDGPAAQCRADCERVLRTLPRWFGIESALVQYAADAEQLPTFLAQIDGARVGFLTLRAHFPASWELHCLAVDASWRGHGIGGALHRHAERWLKEQGAQMLQVKTLSSRHPSPEYAITRDFYAHIGYLPLEEFPGLWGPTLPVLQLIKTLVR